MAPLADTHAHLLSFWGKEVPETLLRAKAAGVDLLVTIFDPIADKRSVTDYSDWLTRTRFCRCRIFHRSSILPACIRMARRTIPR
ncbi:MAG: hypothetical protein ACLTYW_03220 [Collinsella sp.]